MRIETASRTLYHFEELSEEAQETAIERLSDINVDHGDWYDMDYYKENLAAIGFENAKIHFSGFWSQGDGACFDADVDTHKALNAFLMCNHPARGFDPVLFGKWLILAERWDIRAHINQLGSIYVHERTRNLVVDYDFSENAWEKLRIGECEELLEQLRVDACQEIYSILEKEYEYLTSREAIQETIEANEYEFTEDGGLA